MAKVNLSQAAKLVGKNRTTIWRHIKSGKLSSESGRDGMPVVDTSELIRVYGDLRLHATPNEPIAQHDATPSYAELIEAVEKLRAEQAQMKILVSELSNRLTYSPSPKIEDTPKKPQPPESDPKWPKEVKSMKDIMLRNEIRSKYEA